MLKVNNPHRCGMHVNSATIDIVMDRDVKRGEIITLTLNNLGVGFTVTGRGERTEEQERDYPTVLSPSLFSDDGEDGTEQEQVDPATGDERENDDAHSIADDPTVGQGQEEQNDQTEGREDGGEEEQNDQTEGGEDGGEAAGQEEQNDQTEGGEDGGEAAGQEEQNDQTGGREDGGEAAGQEEQNDQTGGREDGGEAAGQEEQNDPTVGRQDGRGRGRAGR